MESLITATALESILNSENLILIDATSGPNAQETYLKEHLANAQFVDLEVSLSAIDDPKNGGRHPLPLPGDFSTTLATLGITADSHVVVYDRANGANAAARFWWMTKAAGIRNIQVLDGGFKAAVEAGLTTSNGVAPKPQRSDYGFERWSLPTVTLKQVQEWTQDPDALIIDVREEARYCGYTEPIDQVAGHIPSAINIPLNNNLEADGTFKKPEVLHAYYSEFFRDKDMQKTIVHCGSGVTACHTLLALDHAGFMLPNLYVGSWSEWSRNDLPIATADK